MGENEVGTINNVFNEHARQNDIAEANTLDTLLLRIEKTKSVLAKVTDVQYGPESQYILCGLIDNHAQQVISCAATVKTCNRQESGGEMQAPSRLPEDDDGVQF